ncbi:hypothetical protein G7Z17_g2976 [Cylindrodendrum hubeiense]|uniref:Uncharacterized protein n=1 Tax=Cylindrodendrum hubeiense TaxID=595255 RepID=A0A9P5HGQ7_9HYPO|nr:hypothetical protein G7Z17_g2976 [Cylindrodendrum hubeiense]
MVVSTVTAAITYTFWGTASLPTATVTLLPAERVTRTVTTTVTEGSTINEASSVTDLSSSTSIVSSTDGIQTATTTGTSAPAETTIIVPGPSTGISTGAIAGAAVGCAIAGLIFGFAAAWFLLRRRSNKAGLQQTGGVAVVGTSPESKGYSSVAVSSSSNDIQIDQFLLTATPDKDIRTELHALGDLIHQHVENNYSLRSTPASISVLSQSLVSLGFTQGSGLSADVVAGWCIQPESRQAGLRHVISHTIFKSIDVNSRSPLSMLPAPIAAFLQSIPPPERQKWNPLVMSLALSKWRSLSALLLHPHAAERSPLPVSDDVVAPQALALADALNTFLHYFVATDERSRREQTGHLQAVIIECTRLGYVLLSHPSDWQFVFELNSTNTRQTAVVVCPGVEKLGRGDGTRYDSPQQIVQPLALSV